MIGKITEAEMVIMELIWESNEPLSSLQILERLPKDNTWKQTTVLTLAKRLIEKEVLQAEKRGKTLYYSPLLSKDEYKGYKTKEFLKDIHGGSVKSLIAALCGGKKLKKKDFDEIRDWFEEE